MIDIESIVEANFSQHPISLFLPNFEKILPEILFHLEVFRIHKLKKFLQKIAMTDVKSHLVKAYQIHRNLSLDVLHRFSVQHIH